MMNPTAVPGIAFVANSLPPYRVHVHTRVAREIPGLRVWTLLTHDGGPWSDGGLLVSGGPSADPREVREALIGRVDFGAGEPSEQQANPRFAAHEWRKGGRVIRWLTDHDVRAVVLLGYNDPGRLRVLRWCRRIGVPCFVWGDSNIRGDIARGARRLFKRLVLPRLLRQATGVLCCGQLGQAFYERYGVPPNRIFRFPNEPDYDLVRGLPADRVARVAERFNLRPDRRRIVFSGRLVPGKGLDLIVDAFAGVAADRPDWDLVIVGDGPLRAGLQDRVPAALRGRVTFTGFFADQADVSAVYRASDVLVLASDREAWALVVNEAVAAGLAVVCSTAVGAVPELVIDRVNGRQFPPGDLPALTACLLDATDPGKVDAYKAAAAGVLADWRAVGDPVDGLARALAFAGVLDQDRVPTRGPSTARAGTPGAVFTLD